MSFQSGLRNHTPFAAFKLVLPDPTGQEATLVLVKATFEDNGTGELRLAQEQTPVHLADVPLDPDRAGRSSPLYEADIALEKPLVDVLLVGSAYAPEGRAAQEVPVALSVGDITKQLLVSGDRSWSGSLLGRRASRPVAFTRMPLVYERAFGGAADEKRPMFDVRNPVGVGFGGARSADSAVASELPNVEYPDALMRSPTDRPAPAGFGPLGRGWQPRSRYAGTFDAAWLSRQWPLLPHDFDPLHNQCAPADQQSAGIRGGEWVKLINLTPEGVWQFRLPRLEIPVSLGYDREFVTTAPRLDTVLIESDTRRVVLTSRLSLRTQRKRGLLREILLGHPTPGYLRARAAGKRFIDRWTIESAARPGLYFEL